MKNRPLSWQKKVVPSFFEGVCPTKANGKERGRGRPLTLISRRSQKYPRREREREKREGILTESPREENHWPTGDAVNETGPIGTERETDEPTKRELFGQLKKGAVVTRSWTVPECTAGQRHKMGWTVSGSKRGLTDPQIKVEIL